MLAFQPCVWKLRRESARCRLQYGRSRKHSPPTSSGRSPDLTFEMFFSRIALVNARSMHLC